MTLQPPDQQSIRDAITREESRLLRLEEELTEAQARLPVTVERVDLTQREEIVAVCRRAGVRQTVPIIDLRLPSPPPAGAEWIDAYRHWLGGE